MPPDAPDAPDASDDPRDTFDVRIATSFDVRLADSIARAIEHEVAAGAIGMARRSPATLRERMLAGDAVIATAGDSWAGFCYVALWDGGRFASTSALIVAPKHRGRGVARRLKEESLALVALRYPRAAPFGLSISPVIARINDALGFREVVYSELPADLAFWAGCASCPLYADFLANEGRHCHCRATLRAPALEPDATA